MYATIANVEARLGSLTDDQRAYFADVLNPAITVIIDRQTETSFGSATETDVYVNGVDSTLLIIPTMHEITAVTCVAEDGTETALSVDEYRTYPQGQDSKYAIRKLNGRWSEGIENYKVTGKLGFLTTPADIVAVATELAINSLNSNLNNYKSERVGDWAVTYADDAVKELSADSKAILGNYRRLSRGI